MGCGAFKPKTVLAIGNCNSKLLLSLASKENVRVLHLLATAGDPVMPENEKYKMITGNLTNRIFLMALFLQYDFKLILSPKEQLTQEVFTVCCEQWAGEYSERSLTLFDGERIETTSFESDFSTPVYTQISSPDKYFDSILL